jgi:hypothetical protein
MPAVGDVVDLPYEDGTPTDTVDIVESYGVARLMLVYDAASDSYGVVAFQPDKSWWWVRALERREPWVSDGDEWQDA